MMIHRLVYMTWRGPIPDGYEINHKNSKPWINFIDNLEITTSLGNIRYSIEYNNRYSKWTKDVVYQICELLSKGHNPDSVREILNLGDNISKKHFSSFCDNLKNKTKYWKDVSEKFDFTHAYSNINKRKYSDEFIYDVLDLINNGYKLTDIARKFNVDIRVISDIKRGIKNPINTRN